MRRAHRLALSAGIVVLAASLGGERSLDIARAALRSALPAAGLAPPLAVGVTGVDAQTDALVPYAVSRSDDGIGGDAWAREEREPTAGGVARVHLDDPQAALGTALALAGRDLGAPRPLELWRIAGERSALVAAGRSERGGALAFPPLVLPAGPITLVAAPHGSGPHGSGASSPVTLRRDPSAPRVESAVRTATDAPLRWLDLSVAPAEPSGAIVVTAPSPAGSLELARAAVADDAESSGRALAIAIALAPDGSGVHVLQELPDGRRSPPRAVVPDISTPEENEDAASMDALSH